MLQGLERDTQTIETYLRQFDLIEPSGFSTHREAAAIFRLARSKGFSVTTVNALMAAIAIEHQVSIFTLDQDFSHIAGITKLKLHPYPSSLTPTPAH